MIEPSNHFPQEIRDALKAAAAVIDPADPNARVKAINRVIERARISHPQLFRTEADDGAELPLRREEPSG